MATMERILDRAQPYLVGSQFCLVLILSVSLCGAFISCFLWCCKFHTHLRCCTSLGDPAGARLKPGSGYGFGVGIRLDSPLGPLRLEYAFNDSQNKRFHFGVGHRN